MVLHVGFAGIPKAEVMSYICVSPVAPRFLEYFQRDAE